jgi:glycerol-3-phosphate acyltransferase PlsY
VSALLALVAAYLLGAIPTSYIVGRLARGIDLREHGSRNLGATNLFRTLGWKFAVPVALFDVAKGAIPVLVFAPLASPSRLFALACGAAAVIGHVLSVFVRFRGGKGVATAAGVMLGFSPLALGIAALVWAAIVFGTGYVSLGSVLAAASLPLAVRLIRPGDWQLFWADVVIALAIAWLHRANIARLLAGTENRFGRRRATAPPR